MLLKSGFGQTHTTSPTEGTLYRQCVDWVNDPYNVPKFRALFDQLCTGEGAADGPLASTINPHLLDGMAPKLRHDKGCWTWNLSETQHRQAVEAYTKARVMAAQVSQLLTGVENRVAADLFQRYFGNPVDMHSATSDRARDTPTTPVELAQTLVTIFGGLSEGNFVLCGPKSTSYFPPGDNTAAFADPAQKNITYLGDRFFHPEDRIDSTTPPGLKNFEQLLVSATTLLHEASHQFANTNDVLRNRKADQCYGRRDCKSLPGNYAAVNADSLSMFVMDLTIAVNNSNELGERGTRSLLDAGSPAGSAVTAAAAASSGASSSGGGSAATGGSPP